MLLTHPRIYLDATGTTTDALLIRDGIIAATGDDARHGVSSEESVRRPDAECLFPALGDAHVHLWGLGLRAGAIDLRGLDADEALDALSQARPQMEGWIFANNLDEHNFSDGQQISRRELDRLYPDHPVCIYRVDRHAIWVNSAALKRAQFDKRYTPGEGGSAARDDAGEFTGYLVDRAMEPILETIPPTTIDEDREVFLESARRFRDHGVTYCTVARSSVAHVEMLKSIAEAGELPLHVDVLVAGMDPSLEQLLRFGPDTRGVTGLQVAGIKFYADGALGSQGAHLLSPYRSGARGLKMHDDGFLKRRIPELMEWGWQVGVHAIGDAANREVLDAFAATDDEARIQLRPRLEHAQMLADVDAPRVAELDVIASIQPIHLRSDAPWAGDVLREEQLRHLYRWRDLLPSTFAAGSDYPIDDPNPWHGIATALTRRGADGIPFRPEHKLGRSEILRAYTRGAAFASHRENLFGTLHSGHRAEIIALDINPFEATPDEVWDTKAEWLEGA